jgi:hypothetical protein
MRLRILSAALLLAVAASPARAATLRVVVVEVAPADLDAYVKLLEEGKALLKSKGMVGVMRAFRARYAGPDAGRVMVSIEYPSLEALAKDDAKVSADPEVKAWLQAMGKLRRVVSDSVYNELSP